MKYVLTAVMLLTTIPALAQPTTQDVLACMQANVLPGSQLQDIELEATDIRGEKRSLKGKLFSTRENLANAPNQLRATLRISSPAHLAGAAYLLRQSADKGFESMFVYLPTVKRVRRISTEFADGSLMGTNFSYQEFKQLSNAFGDLNGKVEGSEKYDGRDVTVMTFSATADGAMVNYSSVRLQVDQKTCVVLGADFMKGNTPRKRFSAKAAALTEGKGFWYLSEMEMRDLDDDTATVLRVLKLETAKKLPRRYFDPKTFYLGD